MGERIARDLEGKLGKLEIRRWHKAHDENIPNLIDRTLSLEQQARQAHSFRNQYRTQARDLMKDQDERKKLDRERPNMNFEDFINDKMKRKNLTYDESLKDTIKTASKTNQIANKNLGLE